METDTPTPTATKNLICCYVNFDKPIYVCRYAYIVDVSGLDQDQNRISFCELIKSADNLTCMIDPSTNNIHTFSADDLDTVKKQIQHDADSHLAQRYYGFIQDNQKAGYDVKVNDKPVTLSVDSINDYLISYDGYSTYSVDEKLFN